MVDLLLVPIAVVYLLIVAALFLYGINFMYLTLFAWRKGEKEQASPPAAWPPVTVQLPIYNELYVAERLIDAASRLDYPAELLQIQVLDDSTDETVTVVRRAVERAQARGVNIVHLHRTDRTGFKAGALQAGLRQATGELVAIFDADFVPRPNFLKHAIPHFQDENVAFVQGRWGHLNRKYSLLTFLQSLAIDAHFMIEQFARSHGGYWFNFNGTAGIWRREALEDAGGWTADTLTEDLDISYRAHLRGWEGRYVRDLEVPAELPVSITAFRRQQHRWARGSLECALKLGPQVWQAPIPFTLKLQATLHLTGYSVHLLLFALSLLYPLVLLLAQRYSALITLFGIAYVFNITALAPTFFFIMGQQQLKRPLWRLLPKILFVTVMGSGLMLNTARAALQIVTRRKNIFERTAKFGIESRKQNWTRRRYQLGLDSIVYFELFFALFNLATSFLAVRLGNWAIAFYAALFGFGLLFVALLTIAQTIAVYRNRNKQRVAVETAAVAESEPAPPWPVPVSLERSMPVEERPSA